MHFLYQKPNKLLDGTFLFTQVRFKVNGMIHIMFIKSTKPFFSNGKFNHAKLTKKTGRQTY